MSRFLRRWRGELRSSRIKINLPRAHSEELRSRKNHAGEEHTVPLQVALFFFQIFEFKCYERFFLFFAKPGENILLLRGCKVVVFTAARDQVLCCLFLASRLVGGGCWKRE